MTLLSQPAYRTSHVMWCCWFSLFSLCANHAIISVCTYCIPARSSPKFQRMVEIHCPRTTWHFRSLKRRCHSKHFWGPNRRNWPPHLHSSHWRSKTERDTRYRFTNIKWRRFAYIFHQFGQLSWDCDFRKSFRSANRRKLLYLTDCTWPIFTKFSVSL